MNKTASKIGGVSKRVYLFKLCIKSCDNVFLFVAYDVPALSEYLDFVSLMAFDYHGPWDGRTGHIAPLYHLKSDTYDHLNIVSNLEGYECIYFILITQKSVFMFFNITLK